MLFSIHIGAMQLAVVALFSLAFRSSQYTDPVFPPFMYGICKMRQYEKKKKKERAREEDFHDLIFYVYLISLFFSFSVMYSFLWAACCVFDSFYFRFFGLVFCFYCWRGCVVLLSFFSSVSRPVSVSFHFFSFFLSVPDWSVFGGCGANI